MNLDRRGWGRGARAAFASALAIASAVACTQVLGINADRHLVDSGDDTGSPMPEAASPESGGEQDTGALDAGAQDAASEAPAQRGPWDCLDDPPELFAPGAMTELSFVAVDALKPITQASKVDGGSSLDLVAYSPLPGLQVRGCSALLHPQCDMGTGTPFAFTDDAGIAKFMLLNSFNGFFQINNADGGMFSTSFYPSQMLSGDTKESTPAPLLTGAAEKELELALPQNVQLSHDMDGGVGHILVSVFDCNDHFASGVAFSPALTSSNPPTVVFYTQGMANIPSFTAQETDMSGAGGLLNVPVGILAVHATLKETAREISVFNVYVNPGVGASVNIRARTH
jgi:hypothetical protein